jgi:hypothetical protein
VQFGSPLAGSQLAPGDGTGAVVGAAAAVGSAEGVGVDTAVVAGADGPGFEAGVPTDPVGAAELVRAGWAGEGDRVGASWV